MTTDQMLSGWSTSSAVRRWTVRRLPRHLHAERRLGHPDLRLL